MRALLGGLCLSLLAVASIDAKIDPAKILAPSDKVVLHKQDVRQVLVYEWERNGVRYNAWPGDGVKPPYDAAALMLRAFSFPTGMVRELFYPQGARTPPHANKENILMYGITGKRAQIVNDDIGVLGPGDASYHPVGVIHHSESVIAGVQLEFAFPGKMGANPQAAWLSAKDVAETPVASWVRNGAQITARGADAAAAPADAIRYAAKFFQFAPGVTLIESHIPKGVASQPHADAEDGLVYVLKGRLRVTIGDMTDEVGEGDVVRDPAGVIHHFEALEDSVFVKASPPPSVMQ